MHYDESAFDTSGGLRLIERSWTPDNAPRAVIAIVHGYAEHSGRYDYVAGRFVERGFAVHALDLRGHGRSDGDRVLVRSVNEYLDDVDAFLTRVRESAGGWPLVLLGHSMGGCVVTLSMIVRRPAVDLVVLSGAVLPSPSAQVPRVVEALLRFVGRWLPRLRLRKLASESVSRDPEIVALYDSDPLNYRGRMPAGLIAAILRATREIDRRTEEIAYPLLILHGGADELSSPDGSRALYERASSNDKTLKVYEGLYHEILNEPERNDVIADIASWIDGRIGGTQAAGSVAEASGQ